MTNNNAPNIYPAIRYADARAAIEWLKKAFGFEELIVVPGENGTVRHAELRLGPGVIMLGGGGKAKTERPRGFEDVDISLYVAVDDPDAHFARAKAAGAEITSEPYDTDHGSRDYEALDLEGNVWWFGTYRAAASE
jgi:uncharacterized glyoxalase superfamily protein PhnB